MKQRDFFRGIASVIKGLKVAPIETPSEEDCPKFETRLIYKTDIDNPKVIGTYIGFMHGTLVFK